MAAKAGLLFEAAVVDVVVFELVVVLVVVVAMVVVMVDVDLLTAAGHISPRSVSKRALALA